MLSYVDGYLQCMCRRIKSPSIVLFLQVHVDGSHERVSGSSLGGGTFWGLARLLTGAQSFDEILALCAQGNNGTVRVAVMCAHSTFLAGFRLFSGRICLVFLCSEKTLLCLCHNDPCVCLFCDCRNSVMQVDMLVGDIYEGDYDSIGLPASTIASSFGKVVSGGLSLEDVKPADAALSALRMIRLGFLCIDVAEATRCV